jgi:hypothetical protein
MRKLTLENFINRSNIIHNNKYNYSLVEYKNISTKVKIICKEHGEFLQTPCNHLQGCGCMKCGYVENGINMRNNNFINDSKKIHDNTYDYSLVDYINNKTKVKIICEKHGIFEQRPNDHLRGEKCPYCFGYFRKPLNEFIKKCKIKHYNTYDYSLVDYVNNKTKIKIICEKHGVFEQTPRSHLNGNGCSKCKFNFKMIKDDFINKSIKTHGSRYNYENVNYINSHTKVSIICKNHGIFEQKAYKHMQGNGCPKCLNSTGVNKMLRILENYNIEYLTEQPIEGCISKYNRHLKFDIFIPIFDIYIEYDGEQHFKSVEIWGGDKAFEESKIRDEIKDNFCKTNNIPLYRISYKDNIEEEMNKILNKLKIKNIINI